MRSAERTVVCWSLAVCFACLTFTGLYLLDFQSSPTVTVLSTIVSSNHDIFTTEEVSNVRLGVRRNVTTTVRTTVPQDVISNRTSHVMSKITSETEVRQDMMTKMIKKPTSTRQNKKARNECFDYFFGDRNSSTSEARSDDRDTKHTHHQRNYSTSKANSDDKDEEHTLHRKSSPPRSALLDKLHFKDDVVLSEKKTSLEYTCMQMEPFLPALTRLEAELIRDLLIAFKSIADANQVTYFMCYGMLLGSFRHGGMIPWDDDLDILVDISYSDVLEKAVRASAPSYEIIKHKDRWKFFSNSETSTPVEDNPWKFPYLDIFFFERFPTYIYDYNRAINSSIIFPLITMPFWDLTFNAPAKPLKYLQRWRYNVRRVPPMNSITGRKNTPWPVTMWNVRSCADFMNSDKKLEYVCD